MKLFKVISAARGIFAMGPKHPSPQFGLEDGAFPAISLIAMTCEVWQAYCSARQNGFLFNLQATVSCLGRV